jgi:hypothetical protein
MRAPEFSLARSGTREPLTASRVGENLRLADLGCLEITHVAGCGQPLGATVGAEVIVLHGEASGVAGAAHVWLSNFVQRALA